MDRSLLKFNSKLEGHSTFRPLQLSRPLVVEHDPSSEDPHVRHLSDLVARLGLWVRLNLKLTE